MVDTILVVEDEPLLRLNATHVLEEAGYSVTEANNAETALELLEVRRDVQVLFTDIHMPGAFNGLELAQQVHRRWNGPVRQKFPMMGAFSPSRTATQNLSGGSTNYCAGPSRSLRPDLPSLRLLRP